MNFKINENSKLSWTDQSRCGHWRKHVGSYIYSRAYRKSFCPLRQIGQMFFRLFIFISFYFRFFLSYFLSVFPHVVCKCVLTTALRKWIQPANNNDVTDGLQGVHLCPVFYLYETFQNPLHTSNRLVYLRVDSVFHSFFCDVMYQIKSNSQQPIVRGVRTHWTGIEFVFHHLIFFLPRLPTPNETSV